VPGEQPAPGRLPYSGVIPTKDRPDHAAEAVGVLLGQTRAPERIVVVDAGGEPYRPAAAHEQRARELGVELVVLGSRPSTSAQRNLGARSVDTPIVVFLDDDVRVPPGYVEALLAHWEAAGLNAFGGMCGTPAELPAHGRIATLVRRLAMLNYVDPAAEGSRLRRGGKVRYAANPPRPVRVSVLGAGATAYRTDLVRAHRFDEAFSGYALGEDLELASRVAARAPLLQVPEVRWTHLWHPRERVSASRWYVRGRAETYFRLKRIDRAPLTLAAFAISLAADTAIALGASLRARDAAPVRGFLQGARDGLRALRGGSRRRAP
jgi:GT2 family glycosyltransferase